jgi:hypothetical protein
MLGDRPALTPPQLAYQRMLAGDPIEAVEQAHEYLKDSSLENYYDAILLKGLRLAEADRQLGHLDDDRLNRIFSTVEELVAELEAHHDVPATEPSLPDLSLSPGAAIAFEQARSQQALIQERPTPSISVVCIPGTGRLDEATALVLAQLLRHRGIGAIAEKADALSMSKLFSLELANATLACVCYLGQPSAAKIQHAVRGLGRRIDGTRILFALLGTEAVKSVQNSSNVSIASGSFGATLEVIDRVTSEQHMDASGRAKAAAKT